MRNLVILAHPHLGGSVVHARLAEMLAETGDVSLHHADTLISEGALDVDEEREACTHASRLVLQFPLYWFAPPASLKVWLDAVLDPAWALAEPKPLAGRTLQVVASYASPRWGESVPSVLLRPLIETARLCGMHWAEPLLLDVGEAPLAVIDPFAERYRALLDTVP
ncbi:NAD(P)H-dependent oxidoreductase [Jeongeupia chitinilytica]|uniref:General stress protein 14 n=1 Tax=Jeongeupia chitinilytica TaxID=1041641 RepID=A0ABQ3H031_9NEIS|nr:NAD(P)H-dependent oxidoreductase [Jeongeupia chitinilytica]GHD61941.1 general stress protein 14 [Jeongeupia chitinilytica]